MARAQEGERRKIAQELHDSTVQHLVAASLILMNLRSATALPHEQQPLWNEVEASLQEAMKELRTFSYLMHPPVLRAQRLRSSLGQYIDGFASRSGIDINSGQIPRSINFHLLCSGRYFVSFRKPWPMSIAMRQHRRSPFSFDGLAIGCTWSSLTMAAA